jgi:hypothetical protein
MVISQLPNFEVDHNVSNEPVLRNTNNGNTITLAAAFELSAALNVAGALTADSASVTNALTAGSATIGGTPYDEKADLTGASGVLVSSQVPDLSITSVDTVADEAERLALDVEEGDVAIQQDTETTYIFTGGDPSVDNNWSALQFDAVAAIAGDLIEPSEVDTPRIDFDDANEPVAEQTAQTGTVTLDLSAANRHRVEADGDVTIEFSNVSSSPKGNSVLVYLYDSDGTGPHTVSWPTNTEWPNGNVIDTIESNSNVEVSLTTDDGDAVDPTWRGSLRGRRFQ